MPYYVYILYSESYDKYYVGQTNSLTQRLDRHNEFELTYSFTSKYRPWTLKAFIETGNSRGDAIRLERAIKALKSKTAVAGLAACPDQLYTLATKVLGRDLKPA